MPYRLRMSMEIGDWIAELCSSASGSPESLTAAEVGAALAAAMSADDLNDLAPVTDLTAQADPVDDGDLRAAVDYMNQLLLEELQRLRHRIAMAAGFRTTSRHRITPTGSESLPFTSAEIAAAEERERKLTQRAQSWQAVVDRFRTMKEVAKARITAAESARNVELVLLESASAAGSDTAEVEQAKADLAAAEASLLTAKARAVAALAQARRILLAIQREVRAAQAGADGSSEDDDSDSADDRADGTEDESTDAYGAAAADEHQAVAAGLLELRADPLGTDVRILCAVEPPGTLTLLAVLEGQGAIREHRDSAIRLVGDSLAEIRAEDGPEDESQTAASDTATGELTFTDAATFLAELFPDSDGEVARRAADLTTATTLGVLRRQRGLSLEDLQARTGMQAQELWGLETGGLRSARLSELAAYLRAAGVTLTVGTDDGTAIVG